jgi:hypothetical protein
MQNQRIPTPTATATMEGQGKEEDHVKAGETRMK